MRQKTLFAVRVCGWVALSLLTLEFCARVEDKLRYGAPLLGNYSIETLYLRDSLGRYGRPGASYLKWHLNEVGYRGPGLRTDTYRIACIGSSETFGLYESPGQEWPRQLEAILNSRTSGARFEVVDTAYPGMSIATSIRRLPQMLSTLHPKVAVIYPSYTPYVEIGHSLSERSSAAPSPARPAANVSGHFEFRLAGRLDTFTKAVLPEGIQHWLRARQIQSDTRGAVVMDRLPEKNIQAFKIDLDSLTAQLLASGVRVVLVTHANRFGERADPADLPILADWRKFFPTLREAGLLDMERRMSEAVREVAAARSVPVVDAATMVTPGASHFVEFVHFNDAGAHALATIVADQVAAEVAGADRANAQATPAMHSNASQAKPRP